MSLARSVLLVIALTGCSGAVYGSELDKVLLKCQNEAKDVLRKGGSFEDALAAYERCKLREGAF